jgi:hypothetical protein
MQNLELTLLELYVVSILIVNHTLSFVIKFAGKMDNAQSIGITV